jgi:hypothetical protein
MTDRTARPNTILIGIIWILVCLGMVVATGCNWRGLFRPTVMESGLVPSEAKKYEDAVNAYKLKAYEQSANRFAAIREQTANPAMARMALYGLACARLMLADTPKKYQDAIALWDTWVQCAPSKTEFENPTLLAPLLSDKMIFSHIPLDGESVAVTEPAPAVPQWFVVRANQELQRLRNQLDTAGQNLESRDKKIKTLEKEIERLNEQIKAFESIDQKIQKKKNAIPSAE